MSTFFFSRTERRGEKTKGERGDQGEEREKVDIPFSYNDRNVTPYIQPSTCVRRRYLYTRISQALLQRTSKHCARGRRHILLSQRLRPGCRAGVEVLRRHRRARFLRRSDVLPPCTQAGFTVALIAVLSTHGFWFRLLLVLLLLLSVSRRKKEGRGGRKRKRARKRGWQFRGSGSGVLVIWWWLRWDRRGWDWNRWFGLGTQSDDARRRTAAGDLTPALSSLGGADS